VAGVGGWVGALEDGVVQEGITGVAGQGFGAVGGAVEADTGAGGGYLVGVGDGG